jgi:hypothetical protein
VRQPGRGWPDVSAVWARDLGEHWGALLPPRRAGGKRIRSAQQLGRLGDVGGDAPRLVAGEKLAARVRDHEPAHDRIDQAIVTIAVAPDGFDRRPFRRLDDSRLQRARFDLKDFQAASILGNSGIGDARPG